MANSITVHANDDSGGSFVITLTKTGADSGSIEIKKVSPSPEDHTFDVSAIKANHQGTKIVCKGFFNSDVGFAGDAAGVQCRHDAAADGWQRHVPGQRGRSRRLTELVFVDGEAFAQKRWSRVQRDFI
jgi:hypothetical protein